MTWIGGTVEKQATFKNTLGALADPDTVTGVARKPTGVTTAATVSNPSTGVFDVLFSEVDIAGMWYYRVVGEGNNADAVIEGSFRVRASSI